MSEIEIPRFALYDGYGFPSNLSNSARRLARDLHEHGPATAWFGRQATVNMTTPLPITWAEGGYGEVHLEILLAFHNACLSALRWEFRDESWGRLASLGFSIVPWGRIALLTALSQYLEREDFFGCVIEILEKHPEPDMQVLDRRKGLASSLIASAEKFMEDVMVAWEVSPTGRVVDLEELSRAIFGSSRREVAERMVYVCNSRYKSEIVRSYGRVPTPGEVSELVHGWSQERYQLLRPLRQPDVFAALFEVFNGS